MNSGSEVIGGTDVDIDISSQSEQCQLQIQESPINKSRRTKKIKEMDFNLELDVQNCSMDQLSPSHPIPSSPFATDSAKEMFLDQKIEHNDIGERVSNPAIAYENNTSPIGIKIQSSTCEKEQPQKPRINSNCKRKSQLDSEMSSQSCNNSAYGDKVIVSASKALNKNTNPIPGFANLTKSSSGEVILATGISVTGIQVPSIRFPKQTQGIITTTQDDPYRSESANLFKQITTSVRKHSNSELDLKLHENGYSGELGTIRVGSERANNNERIHLDIIKTDRSQAPLNQDQINQKKELPNANQPIKKLIEFNQDFDIKKAQSPTGLYLPKSQDQISPKRTKPQQMLEMTPQCDENYKGKDKFHSYWQNSSPPPILESERQERIPVNHDINRKNIIALNAQIKGSYFEQSKEINLHCPEAHSQQVRNSNIKRTIGSSKTPDRTVFKTSKKKYVISDPQAISPQREKREKAGTTLGNHIHQSLTNFDPPLPPLPKDSNNATYSDLEGPQSIQHYATAGGSNSISTKIKSHSRQNKMYSKEIDTDNVIDTDHVLQNPEIINRPQTVNRNKQNTNFDFNGRIGESFEIMQPAILENNSVKITRQRSHTKTCLVNPLHSGIPPLNSTAQIQKNSKANSSRMIEGGILHETPSIITDLIGGSQSGKHLRKSSYNLTDLLAFFITPANKSQTNREPLLPEESKPVPSNDISVPIEEDELDKTQNENQIDNEPLATQLDLDFYEKKNKAVKLNPTKIAEKDWQDPYKLSRLINQQKIDGRLYFGGIPNNFQEAFSVVSKRSNSRAGSRMRAGSPNSYQLYNSQSNFKRYAYNRHNQGSPELLKYQTQQSFQSTRHWQTKSMATDLLPKPSQDFIQKINFILKLFQILFNLSLLFPCNQDDLLKNETTDYQDMKLNDPTFMINPLQDLEEVQSQNLSDDHPETLPEDEDCLNSESQISSDKSEKFVQGVLKGYERGEQVVVDQENFKNNPLLIQTRRSQETLRGSSRNQHMDSQSDAVQVPKIPGFQQTCTDSQIIPEVIEASADDDMVLMFAEGENLEQPVLKKNRSSQNECTPNSKMLDPQMFVLSNTTFDESVLIAGNQSMNRSVLFSNENIGSRKMSTINADDSCPNISTIEVGPNLIDQQFNQQKKIQKQPVQNLDENSHITQSTNPLVGGNLLKKQLSFQPKMLNTPQTQASAQLKTSKSPTAFISSAKKPHIQNSVIENKTRQLANQYQKNKAITKLDSVIPTIEQIEKQTKLRLLQKEDIPHGTNSQVQNNQKIRNKSPVVPLLNIPQNADCKPNNTILQANSSSGRNNQQKLKRAQQMVENETNQSLGNYKQGVQQPPVVTQKYKSPTPQQNTSSRLGLGSQKTDKQTEQKSTATTAVGAINKSKNPQMGTRLQQLSQTGVYAKNLQVMQSSNSISAQQLAQHQQLSAQTSNSLSSPLKKINQGRQTAGGTINGSTIVGGSGTKTKSFSMLKRTTSKANDPEFIKKNLGTVNQSTASRFSRKADSIIDQSSTLRQSQTTNVGLSQNVTDSEVKPGFQLQLKNPSSTRQTMQTLTNYKTQTSLITKSHKSPTNINMNGTQGLSITGRHKSSSMACASPAQVVLKQKSGDFAQTLIRNQQTPKHEPVNSFKTQHLSHKQNIQKQATETMNSVGAFTSPKVQSTTGPFHLRQLSTAGVGVFQQMSSQMSSGKQQQVQKTKISLNSGQSSIKGRVKLAKSISPNRDCWMSSQPSNR